MSNPDPKPPAKRDESLGATLFVLLFGLLTLAFLIVVDRPGWFHIRPMSKAAQALSLASGERDAPAQKSGAPRSSHSQAQQ